MQRRVTADPVPRERQATAAARDEHALGLTAWIPAAARSLALPADPWVSLNVLWRTRVLHEAAAAFFADYPDALGVNLGCGLADPFRALDNHRNRWIDADLAPVIRTRRSLLDPGCDRQHTHTVDLRQPGWWQALGLPERSQPDARPVFVLCEGVMMYLTPAQAQAALREFATHAPPGSRWAMDVISWLGVGCAGLVPSLAATGAQFRWGVRDLDELAALHPRLQLLDAHSVAECWGPGGLWLQALNWPWLGAPPYSVVTLGVSGA